MRLRVVGSTVIAVAAVTLTAGPVPSAGAQSLDPMPGLDGAVPAQTTGRSGAGGADFGQGRQAAAPTPSRDTGSAKAPAQTHRSRRTWVCRRSHHRLLCHHPGQHRTYVCRRVHHTLRCRRARATTAQYVDDPSSYAPPAGMRSALNSSGWSSSVPAVGRLWATKDGRVIPLCTGTLNRVGFILTAAHCLWEGSDYLIRTMSPMYFTPGSGYNGDGGDAWNSASAPYGVWQLDTTWVPGCYGRVDAAGRQASDGHCDIGLARVAADSAGKYAGDYTGVYYASADAAISSGAELNHVGYPGDPPFGSSQFGYGDRPYFCDVTWNGDYLVGGTGATGLAAAVGTGWYFDVPCHSTGGSSGGPWFAVVNGTWRQVGVMNVGEIDRDGAGNRVAPAHHMAFQWFDDTTLSFYCAVLPCSASRTARADAARLAPYRPRAAGAVPGARPVSPGMAAGR